MSDDNCEVIYFTAYRLNVNGVKKENVTPT